MDGSQTPLRTDFYACLIARVDALFELTDAVLCTDGPVRTLVGLSLPPEHRRGHGASYDALNKGWIEVERLRGVLTGLPLPRCAGGWSWPWTSRPAAPGRRHQPRQHLSVARIAEGLAVSWHTANQAVLAEAPNRDGTGPARLLDMVPDRSKQAFATWRRAARPAVFRDGLEVVAMDAFTGFTTATTEQLPGTVAVMDPFHVARLAGDALDRCRRRIQQDLHGHREFAGDPLHRAGRTLHSGADLLTDRQRAGIAALFADEDHVAVEVTWGVYQAVIAAYRHPDRAAGRTMMTQLIETLSRGVPAALSEVTTLGRT